MTKFGDGTIICSQKELSDLAKNWIMVDQLHAHDTSTYQDPEGILWQVTEPCVTCCPDQTKVLCTLVPLLHRMQALQ